MAHTHMLLLVELVFGLDVCLSKHRFGEALLLHPC
jgi:hypothetical protein